MTAFAWLPAISARWLGLALVSALLLACSHAPPASDAPSVGAATLPAEDWRPLHLPGKRATRYTREHRDGRWAWHARADRSASMWRRRVHVPPEQLSWVEFSWWVPALIEQARIGSIEVSDSPVRVVFAFDGDTSRLALRDRLLFEAARAIGGEAPPYATLMYVWDPHAEVEQVIPNARSDRVRKLVVESGTAQLRQWRSYRRDLAADFRRVFGEAPGTLVGVALMTDSDNTGSHTQAWYGDVRLH